MKSILKIKIDDLSIPKTLRLTRAVEQFIKDSESWLDAPIENLRMTLTFEKPNDVDITYES